MKVSHTIILVLILATLGEVSARDLNVIFILVDDWGWADCGVQGSDFFETPNIDRFAAESLRFTHAYAASPVCSPARAAILTGRSPARLDMTIWLEGARDGGPWDRQLLPATAIPDLPREEITLAERFRDSGYFTAHVGKWHLGRAANYPETQGFDVNVGGTYWGAPFSFFYPYRGPWSKQDPEIRYVPVGAGQPGDYLTDVLTEHALQLMEDNSRQPFLLNLWYHTVHTPIEGKPELVDHFRQKAPGKIHNHIQYAAMVASLDKNVGRVLQKLEALNLADSTVVILTSDNGGVDFPSGRSGDKAPTKNVPFRSGKGTLYEGGIRVPLFIRWPGRTQPGTTCGTPVQSQDFFPTLVEGLGLRGSTAADVDGVSLLPLLQNPHAETSARPLYWHYPHYYPRMTPGSAIRDGDWKLIRYYEDQRSELYDLHSDPGETTDLSQLHPERAQELKTRLEDWLVEMAANEPVPNPDWRGAPLR
jgi:arylsulfatase A